MRELGRQWHNLSDHEQSPYKLRAAIEKSRSVLAHKTTKRTAGKRRSNGTRARDKVFCPPFPSQPRIADSEDHSTLPPASPLVEVMVPMIEDLCTDAVDGVRKNQVPSSCEGEFNLEKMCLDWLPYQSLDDSIVTTACQATCDDLLTGIDLCDVADSGDLESGLKLLDEFQYGILSEISLDWQ